MKRNTKPQPTLNFANHLTKTSQKMRFDQAIKEKLAAATPAEREMIKKIDENVSRMLKSGDTKGALKYLNSIKINLKKTENESDHN